MVNCLLTILVNQICRLFSTPQTPDSIITRWSLFNAHTEINKGLNYKVQIQRTQKLHKAFDLIICNDNIV